MTSGTITREKVAPGQEAPGRTSRWTRVAIVLAGLGLAAAIVGSAVMVFGGEEPVAPGGTPALIGDRDAAWLESLERQAAQKRSAGGGAQQAPAQQPPVTDKEEGLRQAEERRAALDG